LNIVFHIFFFQAEDGIRDFHVTGVQTCALPICFTTAYPIPYEAGMQVYGDSFKNNPWRHYFEKLFHVQVDYEWEANEGEEFSQRSEERRVGKEGRSRWSQQKLRETDST